MAVEPDKRILRDVMESQHSGCMLDEHSIFEVTLASAEGVAEIQAIWKR